MTTYILYEKTYGSEGKTTIRGITHDKLVAEAYRKQPTNWNSYMYEEAETVTLEDITQQEKHHE